MAPIVGLATVPTACVGDSFQTSETGNDLNEGDRFENRDGGCFSQQEMKERPHFTDTGLEVTEK